jgi:WD40 repeat protein
VQLFDVHHNYESITTFSAHRIPGTDRISIAFRPDAQRAPVLVTGTDLASHSNVWDLSAVLAFARGTGTAPHVKLIGTLVNILNGVLSVQYSADSRWILTATGFRTVIIWDAITYQRLCTMCTPHPGRVNKVATHPHESSTFATADQEGRIVLYRKVAVEEEGQ